MQQRCPGGPREDVEGRDSGWSTRPHAPWLETRAASLCPHSSTSPVGLSHHPSRQLRFPIHHILHHILHLSPIRASTPGRKTRGPLGGLASARASIATPSPLLASRLSYQPRLLSLSHTSPPSLPLFQLPLPRLDGSIAPSAPAAARPRATRFHAVSDPAAARPHRLVQPAFHPPRLHRLLDAFSTLPLATPPLGAAPREPRPTHPR